MTGTIHLLLVDDHALVRQGLRRLLDGEPDMEVVGEAGSGEEAVELVPRLRPDVVIMDIAMPGMDGIEATRRLKEICPDARVLVLTMHAHERYLVPVVEAGGSGYVLKSGTHTDLITAVRRVASGDVFLYPSAVSMLMKRYLSHVQLGGEEATYESLSPRERDVLRLVAEGYTSAEIGERLFLSAKTADSYRERIADKLGFRRRADFVQYALRLGLLRPPEP